MNTERVYRWRRLQQPGLEVLRVKAAPDGIYIHSDVVDAGEVPFAVSYDWLLDARWRTRELTLRLRAAETLAISLMRTGETSWAVNGSSREDLSGCDEIDLSITPFSNTLGMRRFGLAPGGAGELIALYVAFPTLSLKPSRQRYERIDTTDFLYIDLGEYNGFQANVSVDCDGIVERYENLFERLRT